MKGLLRLFTKPLGSKVVWIEAYQSIFRAAIEVWSYKIALFGYLEPLVPLVGTMFDPAIHDEYTREGEIIHNHKKKEQPIA